MLEKEFDDYYEDRAHKSAGPVVFLSKCLGMLPVIWTDDDAESDCKSYFNLYTFIVFLAWIGQHDYNDDDDDDDDDDDVQVAGSVGRFTPVEPVVNHLKRYNVKLGFEIPKLINFFSSFAGERFI